MPRYSEPSDANGYLADHISLLCRSYRQRLHRDLVSPHLEAIAAAKAIYTAPFVVVSHDTAADPIFTYGNRAALDLFAMSWEELTRLPSRQSAEPPNQAERDRLLAAVTTQGFIEHYSGIRIAKTGQRFRIEDVTVWNLSDPDGRDRGQAAVYSHWQFLDPPGAL